ncbi:MAG: anti-virulence regulator CigR family protein [Hyphomonadaceae bacterium]
MKRVFLTGILIAIVAVGAPALAQGNNKGGKHHAEKPQTAAGMVFGAAAEHDIRAYFQANPLTPQSLPPGIAKNLARGKALPPGIAKRALPGGLASQLPSYPGHEIVVVDRDVFLVNVATQIIVDILTHVF